VFVQLGNEWYARSQQWKLTQDGKLFAMDDAPFVERLVPESSQSDEAKTARRELQLVLDQLNPAAGKAATKSDSDDSNSKTKKTAKKSKKPKKNAKAESTSAGA